MNKKKKETRSKTKRDKKSREELRGMTKLEESISEMSKEKLVKMGKEWGEMIFETKVGKLLLDRTRRGYF